MKLSYLAYRNMVSKPLNLLLSSLLLVLSVSLVTFVFELNDQLKEQLYKNIAPFDMVVGAKGSPLQLVLSSVLHIDAPTGNIKIKDAKTIQNHPLVKEAIPVSYGDNYKGYRILGTNSQYLNYYNAKLHKGRWNNTSFEVVVGSTVAKDLNLKVGDRIISSHGFIDSEDDVHDDHPFKVVGMLKATGTVVDKMLISNLESVWEAHQHSNHDDQDHQNNQHANKHVQHGHNHDENPDSHEHHDHDEDHDHDHSSHDHNEHENHNHDSHDHHDQDEDRNHDHTTHEPINNDEHNHDSHNPHDHDTHGNHDHDHLALRDIDVKPLSAYDENKEITSLLVTFKNPIGMVQLPRHINENTPVQAALPGYEIQRLLNLFGTGVKTINGIAFAILLVSGLSIFIGLLKTIRERRNELALLRTYGLKTSQLLLLVLLEGFYLAFIGFVFGWILGRLGLLGASQYIQATYVYALQITGPQMFELVLLGIIFVITFLATFLASLSIFKLNVAKTLSNA